MHYFLRETTEIKTSIKHNTCKYDIFHYAQFSFLTNEKDL